MTFNFNEELGDLIKESKKLLTYKEYNRRFPEKYRLTYDDAVIEFLKKEYKDEIEILKAKLIKKEFWLKYNEKLLEKKINNVLLPPLIKNELTPTGTQAPIDNEDFVTSIYDIEAISPFLKEIDFTLLDKILDKLEPIDSKIVRMRFGIPPEFDRVHKFVVSAAETGINNATLSKKIKKPLVVLKDLMEEEQDILEEDPYFDEEAFNTFGRLYYNGTKF